MIVTEGNLDPFLVLNDANQNPLATDDNSGGGLNARLTFVIPSDGQYLIQATHAGGITTDISGRFGLNLTASVNGQIPPAQLPTVQPTETSVEAVPPPSDTPPSDSPPAAVVPGENVRLSKLEPGLTIRDTLDRQTAFRFYWLEGQTGEQISVTTEQTDFAPLLVLYDAAFAEQARSTVDGGLTATLAQDGVFFVAVSLPDSQSEGGSYGILFSENISATAGGNFTDITYGQSMRGDISAAVPAVTYRFRGSEGDAVTISMSRAGGDLNSYLYLLDAAGQTLFEDNDSGAGNGDAVIQYTLPADETYLIIATRMGQTGGTTTGSYVLELLSDSAAPVEATPAEAVLPADYEGLPQMAYGDTVEGEITDTSFLSVYVFKGAEGDPVTIEMDSQNSADPNGLDPLMFLLDDGRIPLADNDDIVQGENRDSRIEFTLPRTAYYAIVATRFDQENGTSIGPFTLTLTGPGAAQETTVPVSLPGTTPSDTLVTAGALEFNVDAVGTFDTGAKVYSLLLDTGIVFDLNITADPGLEPVLVLADESLNELASSATGTLLGISVPAGRYFILVAPRFGPANISQGNYSLTLGYGSGEVSNPVVTQPGSDVLNFGDVVNGVIDDDVVSRAYTFTGTAGDSVRITMEAAAGSSLDCYLELQDASGAVVDANDDITPGEVRNSQIVTELPADGQYTILASRYVGPDETPTSGTYTLSLERVDEQAIISAGISSTTTPLHYGETLVGEITDQQYLLFYVFDGTAGDNITISIDNLSGNLDSIMYLYRSSGSGWTEIASNDDSPAGGTYEALLSSIQLPETGMYLVAVGRYGLEQDGSSGSFDITLTRQE